ncbi:MAG: ribonuclease P protein component [Bacteroidetes bacterium]|nr:ribonuclease P protein component [Bacteroidota bacterium]
MGKFTFRKKERLCSQKIIGNLFRDGNSFALFPFRIYWQITTSEQLPPARIAISIPKKKFKKAVDRNLIKRRIKEAYRKNKQNLYFDLKSKNLNIAFILIYLAHDLMAYPELEEKMILTLQKLMESYEKAS